MLMLLKTWRNLESDLKRLSQTWSEAFDDFFSNVPRRFHFLLSGIQYFHECESAACARVDDSNPVLRDGRKHCEAEDDSDQEDEVNDAGLYTEEGLTKYREELVPWREVQHA